jgi:hypothetical protein
LSIARDYEQKAGVQRSTPARFAQPTKAEVPAASIRSASASSAPTSRNDRLLSRVQSIAQDFDAKVPESQRGQRVSSPPPRAQPTSPPKSPPVEITRAPARSRVESIAQDFDAKASEAQHRQTSYSPPPRAQSTSPLRSPAAETMRISAPAPQTHHIESSSGIRVSEDTPTRRIGGDASNQRARSVSPAKLFAFTQSNSGSTEDAEEIILRRPDASLPRPIVMKYNDGSLSKSELAKAMEAKKDKDKKHDN